MDPNLVEMKFDIGDGEESFWAYVQPDITSFYKGEAPSSQVVTPKHKGLATKFINLSNKNIVVYWYVRQRIILYYLHLQTTGSLR